jgi:putative serine protease PepD
MVTGCPQPTPNRRRCSKGSRQTGGIRAKENSSERTRHPGLVARAVVLGSAHDHAASHDHPSHHHYPSDCHVPSGAVGAPATAPRRAVPARGAHGIPADPEPRAHAHSHVHGTEAAPREAPRRRPRRRRPAVRGACLRRHLCRGPRHRGHHGDDHRGLADLEQPPAAAPVIQADGTAPNWTATAKAVSPSVVAIKVTGASGRGRGLRRHHRQGRSRPHEQPRGHRRRQPAPQISVTLDDGRTYAATIAGTDPSTDLAVLTLTNPPSDLTPIVVRRQRCPRRRRPGHGRRQPAGAGGHGDDRHRLGAQPAR